jgi:hypothetical protein
LKFLESGELGFCRAILLKKNKLKSQMQGGCSSREFKSSKMKKAKVEFPMDEPKAMKAT